MLCLLCPHHYADLCSRTFTSGQLQGLPLVSGSAAKTCGVRDLSLCSGLFNQPSMLQAVLHADAARLQVCVLCCRCLYPKQEKGGLVEVICLDWQEQASSASAKC